MHPRQRQHAIPHLLSTVLLPVVAIGFTLAAHAEDGPEPSTSLTFNVGVVSDYRVRGIAQTSTKPAIQAGVDFAMKSGPYLGIAASNVTWVKEFNGASKGSYELDFYGGYKAQITDTSFSYDVGVITYRYPGNDSGAPGTVGAGAFSNANTTEIYGALTHGMYTFKYSRSLGDFLGNLNSSGSQYFDLSAAIDLTNGFTLTPHIGRQLIPNQSPFSGSYTDVALTLTKDFTNGFVVTAALMGTNADKTFYTDTRGRYLADTTLSVGLKYSF